MTRTRATVAFLVAFLVTFLATIWAGALVGRAYGACDAARAEGRAAAVRAHLEREARHARRWDLAWAAGSVVMAGGQLGLVAARWVPLRDYDRTQRLVLQVGAAKAAVGALGHVVLPLRLVPPGRPSGESCADLAAAERALAASARAERTAFRVNHVGGLLVNLGGWLYLGLAHDEWDEGLASFALGYPVALLAVYTQPRASWRAHREGHRFGRGDASPDPSPAADGSWSLVPVRAPGYLGLVLTLGF